MGRILIVDDNEDSGEALAKVLRKAGHEVKHVPNGRDALAVVLNEPPDVVLLDLIMPEMDGPSFLQVVRSYLHMHSLPVVVFTGVPNSPMTERVLHLKVNSVLVNGDFLLFVWLLTKPGGSGAGCGAPSAADCLIDSSRSASDVLRNAPGTGGICRFPCGERLTRVHAIHTTPIRETGECSERFRNAAVWCQ